MRDNWINALALAAALLLASFGATRKGLGVEPLLVPSDNAASVYPESVLDARKVSVKSGNYQRIVSLDPEAARLLLYLVAPTRLVAISSWTKDQHPWGYRFGELASIDKSSEIERIAALEPDLVIVNPLSDAASVARLQELGIAVFDLGGARDMAQSLAHLGTLGELLHQGPRAKLLQDAFAQRMRGLKARLGKRPPRAGMYLTRYGDKFYGGTQGTSYGDLLRLSGVADLAAQAGYRQWPSYTVEQLWALDPALIITAAGQGPLICSHPQLARVAACQPGGQVLEVMRGLESDTGAGLLSAAGELLERVHPQRTP